MAEVEEACLAAIHYPSLLDDELYAPAPFTSMDEESAFAERERYEAHQHLAHRVPAVAFHGSTRLRPVLDEDGEQVYDARGRQLWHELPGDDEHGYLFNPFYHSSRDRLEREYKASWFDVRDGEWKPGLVEYEYERRRDAEARGVVGGPWTGPTLPRPETRRRRNGRGHSLVVSAEVRAEANVKARETFAWLQRVERDHERALEVQVIAALRRLGLDPSNAAVFARCQKLGLVGTLKALASLAQRRAEEERQAREREAYWLRVMRQQIIEALEELGSDPRDETVAAQIREIGYEAALEVIHELVAA